jgi:hypothetical protein
VHYTHPLLSVKDLREICSRQAKKHHQLKSKWLNQELKKEQQSINSYCEKIVHDRHDTEQVIWGRPQIEGRFLCEFFGVNLHIIELFEVENTPSIFEQMIDRTGLIAPSASKALHLIVYQKTLHFVPLIPASLVLEQSVENPNASQELEIKQLKLKLSSLEQEVEQVKQELEEKCHQLKVRKGNLPKNGFFSEPDATQEHGSKFKPSQP